MIQITALAGAIARRFIGIFRQAKPCMHVYRGIDLLQRDETGNVSWPCSLCKHVFRGEHGLLAINEGATITGAWGSQPQEASRG